MTEAAPVQTAQAHYTEQDVVEALAALDIQAGDTLFVHSNVGFFGRLAGAGSMNDCYAAFKRAFFRVLGTQGTLVMPTFSYSFCKQQAFDPDQTPGVCGMLSEALRRDPEALRSADANFSVAAVGRHARMLTDHAPSHSFGPDSVWERFLQVGGQFCNLNFDAGSTFVHYVEKCLHVPYRYDKDFTGTLIRNGHAETRTFTHFVYDHDQPAHAPVFTRFHQAAMAAGLARTRNVGKGQILRISAQDSFRLIADTLSRDPGFLIRGEAAS